MEFSKFEASGNDFILIDDRKGSFPADEALIRRLCHRQFGIGADGVILVQESSKGDFKMCILNSDGKEASMCGNGLRCTAGFVHDILKKRRPEFILESLRDVHDCTIQDNVVHINLGRPVLKEFSKIVEVGERSYRLHLIDTGVPHAVMFVSHLDREDFLPVCKEIRNHPTFLPEGVNVNFAMIAPSGELHLRTFERGIEGETLACGSGAAASAIAAKYIYKLQSPISVVFHSGEKLTCYLEEGDAFVTSVSIEGPYRHVFDGKLDVDAI